MTMVSAESYRDVVGVSHTLAHSIGTWGLLAVVVVGVGLTLRERTTAIAGGGLVVLGALVPVLIAGGLEDRIDTATALRFGLAAYAIALTAIDALGQRRLTTAARGTGMAVTLWPILAITLYGVLHFGRGDAITARLWPEVFRSLDVGVAYAVPLGILAGVLIALAVQRGREHLALAASLLIQLGMTLLFALSHWVQQGAIGYVDLIALMQWNGVGLGVGSLVWCCWQRNSVVDDESEPSTAFGVQLGWTAAVAGIPAVWAALAIVASPTRFDPLIARLGHPLGLIGFGLSATALAIAAKRFRTVTTSRIATVAAVAFVPLLAATASSLHGRFRIDDSWLAYHVMIVGWGMLAAGLTAYGLPR